MNNRRDNLIRYILGFALAASLGLPAYREFRNEPEIPGPNLRKHGTTIVGYDLPTEGDVTMIDLMPGERYRTKRNEDGSITFTGPLPYEIKPQRRFMPDDGHTDSAGNTPEEKTYWSDTRDGSVTVTNSPKK